MPLKSTHFPLDRTAFVLIGLIAFSAAWSVAVADWMPRLDLLGLTVIVALFSSALISTRHWRPRYAHLLSLTYGLIWVIFIALIYMPDKVYGYTWLDTIRTLLTRLGEHIYIWREALISGGVATDNTIFLLFFAAIFWMITYVGVWNTVRRQHLWLAVAPSGIALLVNMYYYGKPEALAPFLIIYLLAVLLYAARLYTLNQEQRWNFSRVRFNPEIKRDFLQIGLTIALAAVSFAVIAPSVFSSPQVSSLWGEISRPIRSVEETFNRLFAGLQPHGLPFTNPFGRTLALAGQRNLGDELVMEVRSPEGRYWQAVVYDQYSGTAFQSSDTQRVSVSIGEPIVSEPVRARRPITQTFYTYFPNNTQIFAAPQPESINRPSWAESFSSGEIAMWTTLAPLTEGESYQVVSLISQATPAQLRAAGTQYAPEIRARYLQLPDSLPQRVRELARKIVADAKATNPYDQVSALERWLRINIKYNNQINSPAPGQDGVDYLLFGVREGFCDYYASALAVMARSLGIPARVVTGYAQGEYDSERSVYQVHQFNAHTWAEAYFPDYGWIQFEPTSSQPAIERPRPADTAGSSASDDAAAAEMRQREHAGMDQEFDPFSGSASDLNSSGNSATAQAANISPIVWLIAIGAGMILLVAGGGFVAIMWYEKRGTPPQAGGGTWAFARLSRMTRWLRLKLSAADTPYEQAKTIGLAVPERQEEIDQLADLYVRERYGRAEVDLAQPRSIWERIHWSLWRAGFKRRLRWPTPRLRHKRLRR
jgi:transglutaminase-like putative cysteine protease